MFDSWNGNWKRQKIPSAEPGHPAPSTALARQEQDFVTRPAHHFYGCGIIRLLFLLVLHGAASFRGASACLNLLAKFLPGTDRTPTAWCGELWIWRIGLYEILRPKEPAEDRVWIVDHTVQIGTTKCLVIVSVRLSWWQEQRRPLEHRDLEVLTVEPVEHSDGHTVEVQLECKAEEVGVPRAIISDHGSDLKRGIEAFQQTHPETASVYDIAHQIACLLKHELEADQRWSEFLRRMGETKPQLQQTALAFLTPPSPKSKARYMNLEELVRWGRNALDFLDHPRPVEGTVVDEEKLEEKLGWLREFRGALSEWEGILQVVSTTLEYVRHEGYHERAGKELRKRLKPLVREASSRRLARDILRFVEQQSTSAKPGERLIGSSECLESLIGKGKRLERQQSKSGFTRMVLAMAAAVAEPTTEYLKEALAAVTTSDVYEWARDLLGPSVQSQRRRAFAATAGGTKTG